VFRSVSLLVASSSIRYHSVGLGRSQSPCLLCPSSTQTTDPSAVSDVMAERTPSPQSGRSSLQLPGAPNGLAWDTPMGISSWNSKDPRASSTQSLLPSVDEDGRQRRTLLVIYVHGFMGNDSSFRSFPAHVHHFLRDALSETHVIHTKIYPRYKTYKSIDVARDNFSRWLVPHEGPTTDVVLVGHSMGGLLAADVVLLVCFSPALVQLCLTIFP